MVYDDKVLVISGPSGVGKTFLVQYLERNFPFKRVVPTTTRRKRMNELEGKDYFFVSEEEFLLKLNNNELIFWSRIFNNYYGYEFSSFDKIRTLSLIPVFEIYTPLIPAFSELFPRAFKIFLVPESFEFLKQRMILRGDSEEQILQRLKHAQDELDFYYSQYRDMYEAEFVVVDNNTVNFIAENIQRYFEDVFPHFYIEGNPQFRK